MHELYIAYDVGSILLSVILPIVFLFYILSHIFNYILQQKDKYPLLKYIFQEITSATSTVFYALVIAFILLYITFTSEYAGKISADLNITNGPGFFKYIIRSYIESLGQ